MQGTWQALRTKNGDHGRCEIFLPICNSCAASRNAVDYSMDSVNVLALVVWGSEGGGSPIYQYERTGLQMSA